MSGTIAPDEPRAPKGPWLLTVPQVADLLAVSRRAVWSFISGGRLTAVRLGSRTTRIDSREVERLIETARDAGNK